MFRLCTAIISFFIVYIARNKEKFSFKNVVVASLILTMMASMLNSFTYLIDTPSGFLNTIIAVNFSMVSMAIAIIAIFWSELSMLAIIVRTREATTTFLKENFSLFLAM